MSIVETSRSAQHRHEFFVVTFFSLNDESDCCYTHIYTTAYFFSSGHLSSSPLTVAVAPLFVILWGIPHCQTCSSDHSWVSFGFHPLELLTRFAASTGWRLVELNTNPRHWSIHFRDGRWILVSLNDILSCVLGEIVKSSLIYWLSGEWMNEFVFFMWFSFVFKLRRSWLWGSPCTVLFNLWPTGLVA